MQETLEHTILKNLIWNEEYSRKVLPFIKEEYFGSNKDVALFTTINDFVKEYNNLPSVEALNIELDGASGVTDQEVRELKNTLIDFKNNKESSDLNWLVDSTEKWCQERAVYNAMSEALGIMNGTVKNKSKNAIPSMLEQALGISFTQSIGMDYYDDFDRRYEHMHKVENRIPFDLSYLNYITKGGLLRNTLNVLLGGTNVGKTLVLCHLAAGYLREGYNVLYLTMEMSELLIGQRIDANNLGVAVDDLPMLTETQYGKRLAELKTKTNGRLFIKDFPTSQATSLHFQALINDLKLKKKFKPDIIIVDYINICASSRFLGNSGDSYNYVKAIAEELRGLAYVNDAVLWTATQVNRAGFNSSDLSLENTSESFGLPFTADLMLAISSNEELEIENLYLFKQLKNRNHEINGLNRRSYIRVNKPMMKLSDAKHSVVQSEEAEEHQTAVEKPSEDQKNKFEGLKF